MGLNFEVFHNTWLYFDRLKLTAPVPGLCEVDCDPACNRSAALHHRPLEKGIADGGKHVQTHTCWASTLTKQSHLEKAAEDESKVFFFSLFVVWFYETWKMNFTFVASPAKAPILLTTHWRAKLWSYRPALPRTFWLSGRERKPKTPTLSKMWTTCEINGKLLM